jgi:transposase
MTTKRCSTCRQVKPLAQFYCERKSKDGRQYNCKECQAETNRRWHRANAQYLSMLRVSGARRRPTPERCPECL